MASVRTLGSGYIACSVAWVQADAGFRRYMHNGHAGLCRYYSMRISKENEQKRKESGSVIASVDLARNIAVEAAHNIIIIL